MILRADKKTMKNAAISLLKMRRLIFKCNSNKACSDTADCLPMARKKDDMLIWNNAIQIQIYLKIAKISYKSKHSEYVFICASACI